jgi:hypothetical protein
MSAVGSNGAVRLHGDPGRVLHGAVLLRDLSRHPVTVILQRADIENAGNGNANYVTTPLSGAGLWLRISETRVHLAPHTSRQVAYTVRIRATATGASHYAGIVAINAAELSHPVVRGKSKGHAFVFYRISRQALPLTIRLPGPLSRSLALRSVKLSVASSGASLVLWLLPGGTVLTEAAKVKLRVLRGTHTILRSATGLGQLFPVGGLNYRIAWPGRPTPGTYRVVGTISPQGLRAIHIKRTIKLTSDNAKQPKRVTPAADQASVASGTPGWVWIALTVAVLLLIAVPVGVWKLARQPAKAAA